MPLFDLPKKSSSTVKGVVDRVNKSTPPPILMKSTSNKKNVDIMSKINNITAVVTRSLGNYSDKYDVIKSEESLISYVDKCIENGIASIDTETSGLDPLLDKLAGISIYTPGEKASYIPLNHISYVTGLKVNSLSEKFVKEQFERLRDAEVKLIFFNAKFDLRVLKNQLGVSLSAYWDGYVAAKLLNENEESSNLKSLHNKYCLDGKGDAFRFDDLFEDFNFQYIPVRVGYLYAARDAEITYELYEFQKPFLTKGTEDCELCDLERVSDVFWNIEMPLIQVLVDLEDTGIAFDQDISEVFSKKYHEELKIRENKFHEMCKEYKNEIDSYRRIQGINCKLEDPINIASASQIAILLYDILKLESSDKNHPRGTGEDILVNMEHPIAKTILDYREVAKLLNTFVDKLPKMVNPVDGRIHASFNACGTVTGRLSCISEGTIISCINGDKEIQNIKPGECVYCYDENGKLEFHKVVNCWFTGIRNCVKLNWVSKSNDLRGELICTPDHFIRCADSWVMAKDLTSDNYILGDIVWHEDKGYNLYSVISIEFLNTPYKVYDLEIEGVHNFIANKLCVHNSSNPNCQQIPSRGPGKEVRNMFRATISKDIDIKNSENSFVVNLYSRIPTDRGYLYLDELKVGDKLILEDSGEEVKANVTEINRETGSIYYDFE